MGAWPARIPDLERLCATERQTGGFSELPLAGGWYIGEARTKLSENWPEEVDGQGILLTEEQQAAVIDFLRAVSPETLRKIAALKAEGDPDRNEEGPSKYDFELFRIWHEKVSGLHELKSKDPDLYANKLRFMILERECDDLAGRYKNAAKAEQGGLRSSLAEKVSELFDLREAGRQEEVKKMEAELEELREKLAERQSNKALIVERRVSELLVGSDALKW